MRQLLKGVDLAEELGDEVVDDGLVWDGGHHTVYPCCPFLLQGLVGLKHVVVAVCLSMSFFVYRSYLCMYLCVFVCVFVCVCECACTH